MARLERDVQFGIREALGALPGVVHFRNTVGMYKEDNRIITYGLGKGSADLIGLLAPAGRFFALEVKRPGERARPEQALWLELIRKHGGFASTVHSEREALEAIERAKSGLSL